MSRASALIRSPGRLVPRGSSSVTVGLGVLGVSSYAYLALAFRSLDPVRYSGLSVLWVLIFTVGPGVFLPLEQELGRVVASRRAVGAGYGEALAKAGAGAAAFVLLCVVVVLLVGDRLSDALFAGDRSLLWCLVSGVAVLAAGSLARALIAGRGLFHRYALQLGSDGALRLLAGLGLLLAGVRTAWVWGLVLTLAPLVAVVVSVARWPVDRSSRMGAAGVGIGFSHAFAVLLVATLASQVLVNGSVVAAQLVRDEGQAALVGSLLVALIVARVPLFLYAAVQAALLPRLAESRARGDRAEFSRLLLSSTGLIAGLALANVVAVAGLGPWAVHTFFGLASLSRLVLFVIATATACYLVASVLSQGLLALERHVLVCVAWLVGVAVFSLVFAASAGGDRPLDLRVAYAYLLGSVAAAAGVLVLLVMVRRRAAVTP